MDERTYCVEDHHSFSPEGPCFCRRFDGHAHEWDVGTMTCRLCGKPCSGDAGFIVRLPDASGEADREAGRRAFGRALDEVAGLVPMPDPKAAPQPRPVRTMPAAALRGPLEWER